MSGNSVDTWQNIFTAPQPLTGTIAQWERFPDLQALPTKVVIQLRRLCEIYLHFPGAIKVIIRITARSILLRLSMFCQHTDAEVERSMAGFRQCNFNVN